MSSNQPASVSIGEPQLPICTNSHGYFGSWISCAWFQKRTLSEVIRYSFSPSVREIMAYLPSIFRGKSAMPLSIAYFPPSVWTSRVLYSWISMSWGRMREPLNAV